MTAETLFLYDDEPLVLTPRAVPLFFYGDPAPGNDVAAVPVVTLVSPAPGSPLVPTDTVVYDVTCAVPFVLVAFSVRLGVRLPLAQQTRDAAYDRDHPAGPWDPRYAGSIAEQLSSTHYRLTLRRSPGWPGGGIGVLPRVVSASGGIAA